MIERVVIDVATPEDRAACRCRRSSAAPACATTSAARPMAAWDDVQWAPDGRTLAFVSTSRDHKHEWLRIADAATGAVRTAFEESVADLLPTAATTR